ncbi:TMEM70 family [Sesbania bispinosa]|nr:TMEM70 family [Sesbania bispinosa]
MLNAASKRLFSLSSHFQPIFLISSANPRLAQSISLSCNDEFLDSFDALLQRCLALHQVRQLHSQLVLTAAHHSAFLAARLITVYARFGFVSDARKVFDAIPVEGLQHLLWNSIIRANVSHGYYDYAVELYIEMRKLGFLPDGFTLPLIIRACSYLGSSSLCRIVHCHALQMGFRNHLHVVNELVGMYGKLGRMEDACQLFEGMVVRSLVTWNTMVSGYSFNRDSLGASRIFKRMELEGLQPNSVTWTSLLSSHSRCGLYDETLELFKLMRTRGIEISAEALAVVLSICADMAEVNWGIEIHGYVIKGGYEDYLFVKNALIGTYGKHEHLRDAHKVFFDIKKKNLVSWNALISAYAESGLCEEAYAVFSQLEKSDAGNVIYLGLDEVYVILDELALQMATYHCFRSSTYGRLINANPTFKTPISANPTFKTSPQIRWASQATTTEEESKISIGPAGGGQSGERDKETGVVYYGPISTTIKKVKLLSLSTCCLSVSLGPVITFMTSPDMNVILKGAVASSVIFFSATTTAVLHWFVSPYIHKLRWQPGSDSFEVEMMSWLATYIPKTIKFSDIRPPETNRPFVTFKANGNFYFVDTEHCHNKALLARLTPQKVTHDSAFKNL